MLLLWTAYLRVASDVTVNVTAEPVNPPGQALSFPATHANATNKLYYAANVQFPTRGAG